MSHIFISYSTRDIDLMLDIYQDLRTQGLSVWIDKQGIVTGAASWRIAIQQAIETADCIVVLLSPHAKSSGWVQEELGHARLHRKQIYPVLLHGDEREIVPFGFSESQWVDIRDQYEMLPAKLFPALAQYLKITLPMAGVPSMRTLREEVENIRRGEELTREQHRRGEADAVAKKIDAQSRLTDLTNAVLQLLPPPFSSHVLGLETDNYQYPSIAISKSPVSNAQYKVFLDASDGYSYDSWWGYSNYAKTWRTDNPKSNSSAVTLNDHNPCTNVTWYEAVAFCRWLTAKLKRIVNLPLLSDLRTASHQIDFNELTYEWCLNQRPQETNIKLDSNASRALYTQKADKSRATPEFFSSDYGFRICIMDHYLPLKEIDLEMSEIKLDTKLRIDEDHNLWKALAQAGAMLKGNKNPFPVQIKNRIGYITYQVRRAYTESGHLNLGGYTLRDAVGAGDNHPFWNEVGLEGVPLLWGAAAIVFYLDNNIPYVVLGLKQQQTDNNVLAVFGGQSTIPAGIVDVADFTDSKAATLKDALGIAAKREFAEETNLSIPDEAFLVDIKAYYELQRCKQQAFVFFHITKPTINSFRDGELINPHFVNTSKIVDEKVEHEVDGKIGSYLLSPEAMQALALLPDVVKKIL